VIPISKLLNREQQLSKALAELLYQIDCIGGVLTMNLPPKDYEVWEDTVDYCIAVLRTTNGQKPVEVTL
jgi:hypothetical protein